MSAEGECCDKVFAAIEADLSTDGEPFPTRRAAATALTGYFERLYNRCLARAF